MWLRLLCVLCLIFIPNFTAIAAADNPGDVKDSRHADDHGDPLPDGAIARLGTLRLRHAKWVRALVFAPNGKILASAGDDEVIQLWDLSTGKVVGRIPGFGWGRTTLVFAPDSKTLAVFAWKSVTILDTTTGKKIREWKVGGTDSSLLALAGNGGTIITGDFDPVGDGGGIGGFGGGSPEYKITLRHWDVASGRKKAQATLPDSWRSGCVVAPSARAADQMTVYAYTNKTIKAWAADTAKPGLEFTGHTKEIYTLAVSPCGNILASGSYDETIRLWDTATGKQLRTLTPPKYGSGELVFSPDGKTLASHERFGTIYLWDVANGKSLDPIETKSYRDAFSAPLAFSPDSRTLAASQNNFIQLWDLQTRKERLTWPGHRAAVNTVAFAEDGKTLASGGADGAVLLWDPTSGAKTQRLDGNLRSVCSVAFAPGKRQLAAGGEAGVHLWETGTRKLVHKRDGFCFGESTFFPDGKTLLLSTGYSLSAWSTDTDKTRHYDCGPQFLSGGSLTPVEISALSPDGKTLVTGTIHEGPWKIYDGGTGRLRNTLRVGEHRFSQFRFAPDSQTLAAQTNQTVSFWNVPQSILLRSTVELHDSFGAMAFSPDGRTLALGHGDGSISLVEPATAGLRLRFGGHIAQINALNFSPDGRLLATASGDGTVLVWDLTRLPGQAKTDQSDLSKEQLQSLWTDLGSQDAAVAYRAVVLLRQDRKKASAFLVAQTLRMEKETSSRPIPLLIADLENESFVIRTRAQRDLDRLGDVAFPALREVLAGSPTLELRRRAELLLQGWNGTRLSLQQHHLLRTIEVLERSPNTEVRQWLNQLAKGAPESRLTNEAQATIDRTIRLAKAKP